jgi:N-acetylmuramoyl-L-alanine amidase
MKPFPLPVSAMWFLAAAVISGNLLSVGAAQQAGGGTLTAVRFWSLGEVTRVAVETDREVQYRWERIENPDRVFFDLIGIRARAGQRGLQVVPVGDKLLKQIRTAETRPGTTRVVLDLAAPVEVSASQLTNPDRLMIELRLAVKTPAPLGTTSARDASSEPRPSGSGPKAEPTSVPVTVSRPPASESPAPPPPAESSAPAKTALAESKTPPAADAQAAKRDSRGSRSLIRALGLKLERVVIDPGHGGHDTGSVGPAGLAEKDLVLDIAKRLGALITERLGSQVFYTRTDDSSVSLEARTELANQNKADLFLSLHANSSRLRSAAGSETYYLNFTTSASEIEVAARENASSQKSIYELQELVQKITLKEKARESREFAATVQKALYSSLWRGKTGVKDRGVKKAPFVVLIGAPMPSVLAEIDFLSNPREEKLLKRSDYRQRIAEALYKGLAQYASTLSHFQVAQKN